VYGVRHLAGLQLTRSRICLRETHPLVACKGQEDAFSFVALRPDPLPSRREVVKVAQHFSAGLAS
jgi:hypothetical protein